MKVLLDTNIIIHREASSVIVQDIGILFNWMDKLKFEKYIHPITVEELKRNRDQKTVATMEIKISSYNQIRNLAPTTTALENVCNPLDVTPNDVNDTKILNEVVCERVDILISEDKKIHTKARLLGIADRVFKIDQFLEKVTSENPELVNYNVLSVRKADFAQIDSQDTFFDSFREDYDGFDRWFNKKADEIAYVCYDDNILVAFLYIKVEEETENYSDIEPNFRRARRLKIGTFKVISNGFRLGERFLKIIFDNALQYRVEEIYVTVFDKRPEQVRLIGLLEEWGFQFYGHKTTPTGDEKVFVKNFQRNQQIDLSNPKKSFPFSSSDSRVFLVPIYPAYHTNLFPDSILNTESPKDFSESFPHRNSLRKVYVSRSHFKDLTPGDLIVFYRTGGFYEGVATTVGIVESVISTIADGPTFVQLCRKRSVFTDAELLEHWNYRPNIRPFIVNFLYAHSFRKRPNLKWLIENGIIPDIHDVPRGFREISREDLQKIKTFSLKP